VTHTPTTNGPPLHKPTTCFCCGRHATGIGLEGFGWNGDGDPHYICQQCAPLIQQIKATMRFDVYEDNAVQAAIEAVGPLIERNGSDLADWSEQQVTEFVTSVILEFGSSIRKQVREGEVPF